MSDELNLVQKKSKRGGARANAGRKKGTPNKYSALCLLEEIAKADTPFEIGLAEDYANARKGDDKHLIHKYQAMILNKVVPDKTAIDMTSNGETITPAVFDFSKVELVEWKK